ncbi:MAG: stalk domain-containing protein, partial [Ruminiclostridium sp.]|nr:stalk domain-containing protein [Ruminiclostridium sp.]
MKKTVFFLLILISLIFLSCSVFAAYDVVSGEVNVYVNDTKIAFDTQPVFIKNRTMVPIRGVFEAMGATVDWDNNEKIVTIEKGIKIQVQLDNQKALVDGKTILMDVPAVGINGRILVPIRFISEALKANVDWVNSTKTVFINENFKNTGSGNIQNGGKFYANKAWNYYITEDFALLKENVETKKLEKIADNVVCDIHIYDDWVYCIGIDKGVNKALRINQYSKEKEIIVDAPIDSIQVVNNWVYYSHSGEDTTLYRTKADGSVTERIMDGGNFYPKSWLVQNGWIYYQNLKNNTISRARTDGSDLTEISKLYATSSFHNSNSIQDFDDNIFEIKLIDKDFLYLSLGNPGYIGELYYDSGIYRIPINGGNPEIITNKVPASINMDDEWIYMAVKSYSSYQLVKCRKNGSELFTINEYKQNDIPKSIYINNSTLLYTLLRGTGA